MGNGERRTETGDRKTERAWLAIKMYREGVPVDKIRRSLDIGYQTFYDAVHASGVPMRGGDQQCTDPEKLRQAVAMYQAGERVLTIKLNLRIAEHSLYKALKTAGVPLRHKRRRKRETPRYENKRPKRARRKKQISTNIVMLQNSYGEAFAGLANRALAGELAFRI